MNEINDKKCLECANSKCVKIDDENFEYICCLSKAKSHKCLSEENIEDYFREM